MSSSNKPSSSSAAAAAAAAAAAVPEFPDLEAKLHKPTKQSAFERQKAEAEAKRQREAAETAAVYEDFVKSFDRGDSDDDGDDGRGGVFRRPGPPFHGRGRGGGIGSMGGGGPAGFAPGSYGGGSGKRHFGVPSGGGVGAMSQQQAPPKTGPGSLGPTPMSFGRKRPFETFQGGRRGEERERDGDGGRDGRGRSLLAFDDYDDETAGGSSSAKKLPPRSVSRAFDTDDDDDGDNGDGDGARERDAAPHASSRAEEKAIARPTLRLANLPPGTSQAVIKALIPAPLVVEGVKMEPTPAAERRSATAVVTLAKDSAANDMDAAVSALQNRYLGFGFHLKLHRHLSSAVSSSTVASLANGPASHAFGAKPVPQQGGGNHGHHGQHHNHHHHHHHYAGGRHRGIPPPSSYAPLSGAGGRSGNPSSTAPGTNNGVGSGVIYHVPVQPPADVQQLRLIHGVVEAVLKHGPELEALLMSRPDVQRDERWAWLWDARSRAGVWYRWRLWEMVTGHQQQQQQQQGAKDDDRKAGAKQARYLPLFEDSYAWRAPDRALKFEHATRMDDFVSDPDYDSSDADDDFDDEPHRAEGGGPGGGGQGGAAGGAAATTAAATSAVAAADDDADGLLPLGPLDKAKLTHLLARLPTSIARLRKGDVARVTAFALTHASRGADEVVDLVVANVESPFALAAAAGPDHSRRGRRQAQDSREGRDAGPNGGASRKHSTDNSTTAAAAEKNDGGPPSPLPSTERGAATTTTTTTTTTTAPPPPPPADPSGASLVGLYVISDLLSASSSGAARRAWRYRSLLEQALLRRRTLELLGAQPELRRWGRLRADKWRRSVGLVLALWEGWSVFAVESQSRFVRGFDRPDQAWVKALKPPEEDEVQEEEGGDKGRGREEGGGKKEGEEGAVASVLPDGAREEDDGGGDETRQQRPVRLRLVDEEAERGGGADEAYGGRVEGRGSGADEDEGDEGEEEEEEEEDGEEYEPEDQFEDEHQRRLAILEAEEEYVDVDMLDDNDEWDEYATDGVSVDSGGDESGGESMDLDEEDEAERAEGRDEDDEQRQSAAAAEASPVNGAAAGFAPNTTDDREPQGKVSSDDATQRQQQPDVGPLVSSSSSSSSSASSTPPVAPAPAPATKSVGGLQVAASSVGQSRRQRMRAVDMFADSDDEADKHGGGGGGKGKGQEGRNGV